MLFNTAAALLLAVAAQAITITHPSDDNNDFKTGETVNIQWNHVDTDPKQINIVLRTKQSDGYQDSTIAENVDTSAGSYSWTPTAVGDDLKISFLNADSNSNNNGILAESKDFEVEQGSGSNTSPTSSGAATSVTSLVPTATGTSSNTGGVSPVIPNASPSGGNVAPNTNPSGGNVAPNASGTSPNNSGSALVPSLALVGGSLLALLI